MKRLDHKSVTVVFLIVFILLGTIFRVYGLGANAPLLMNTDEKYVVTPAISMIAKHTFSIPEYNRPDHFEIRCLTLLFTIYSRIAYGVSADVAFVDHSFDFYYIGRLFVSFWGILMIPMAYLIMERIKRKSGLPAAFLTSVLGAYISHSQYVTPDIVLSFFMMLVIYFAIRYMEKPNYRYLLLMCAGSAVASTIKYPAILLCILIATIVIVKAIQDKQSQTILKKAIIAIASYSIFLFIASPDLFLHVDRVMYGVISNSKVKNINGLGDGFFSNIAFYANSMGQTFDILFLLFSALGLAISFIRKNKLILPLLFLPFYLLVLSMFALRWVRWGVPMMFFFIAFATIGLVESYEFCSQQSEHRKILHTVGYYVLCPLLVLYFGLNYLGQGLSEMYISALSDTRVFSNRYFLKNGITLENSVSDYYTQVPKKESKDWFAYNHFEITESGKVQPVAEDYDKTYAIILTDYAQRFINEPGYEDAALIYQYIVNNYELVAQWTRNCEWVAQWTRRDDFNNNNSIRQAWDLILHHNEYITGPNISVYLIPNEET